MMEHKNNRGQMEAFGLAIIVILIIIGFFFFVSFKAQSIKDAPQYQKEYVDEQAPQKFVIAFTKLTVKECDTYRNKQDIEYLIHDCATVQQVKCGAKTSCELVNETAQYILGATFIPQNRALLFKIDGMGNKSISISTLGCIDGPTRSKSRAGTSFVTLYPYPGQATITLTFCTQ
ncbi:MAG: hypothetical protein WC916_07055 [Candidatus Woesearchaeota archaeon]